MCAPLHRVSTKTFVSYENLQYGAPFLWKDDYCSMHGLGCVTGLQVRPAVCTNPLEGSVCPNRLREI